METMHNKHFYFRLALLNLAIVALLGLSLRLKILFELPFIDYHNLLTGHSHFAFTGWVSFTLLVLLVYGLLPGAELQRRFSWMLIAVNVCAYGMLASFPFQGYGPVALLFSTLFIIVTFVFAARFLPLLRNNVDKSIHLFSLCAILALLFSAAGPMMLGYIAAGKSKDANLYRTAIYWFLHFQYNGFFTLGIFAHLFRVLYFNAGTPPLAARRFAFCLCASVLPTLFLSLLWHNKTLFYVIGAIGVLLLFAALFYFIRLWLPGGPAQRFRTKLGRRLLRLSLLSFALKLLLQAGTLIPALGNAVYGDRPVIIGFLHLVFLGFVSFYLLATLVEEGYFTRARRMRALPVYVFGGGVFANEILLMCQGLGVLLQTNSYLFNWGLLGAALLLFSGAVLMAVSAWRRRIQ
ncbi:hypothetical protein EPD60_16395 [Flaviaesturariibacter flavus]|uniref:NnrS family protein n=1 Tax=Flaviaesturariibacter flavus TaxID=2502780 RepID=A0A4R1B2R9_9BACT|nr:hypothetical protein [Flaviaesturariibacter flavus]TCJ12131.1 hypothetical protein EPD60_16395 [Flaviaesturariibacter flavus]